jgi:hypothetical protein
MIIGPAERRRQSGLSFTAKATTAIDSPTSATGSACERTPWRATQRATWEALKKAGPVMRPPDEVAAFIRDKEPAAVCPACVGRGVFIDLATAT